MYYGHSYGYCRSFSCVGFEFLLKEEGEVDEQTEAEVTEESCFIGFYLLFYL